ncbi:MAG: alpha/beta hydrolase, partial [Gemmatimonadaceae bacterium]|nr:alpha/beta hydrolase [Gloeobacterales cyanobacterium ES-bin-141]
MSVSTPSLIFLHHFGGSARTWAAVTGLLDNVQCFVPNLRGFGGFVPSDGSYGLEDYALDVASLV